MPIHYLGLEMVLVLASYSIKEKKETKKKMRGVAMVTSFSSTKHRGKYSQCPAFDIKQSPAGRSPEDHQVRTHAYLLLNNARSCFMLPLSVLVCFGLNVCGAQHIHRFFKLSMVLWLKCPLLSNLTLCQV